MKTDNNKPIHPHQLIYKAIASKAKDLKSQKLLLDKLKHAWECSQSNFSHKMNGRITISGSEMLIAQKLFDIVIEPELVIK